MINQQVEQVRSFNRAVTQRIGVLQDRYLSRGRPLGEARLIFEVGIAGDSADVRTLRRRLGLDAGYMSRLLRSLEAQDMIELRKKADDGRVREIRLTEKGRAEFEAYDRLSDELAGSILTALTGSEREKMVNAMSEVERLLRAASIALNVEPADSKDARWCLDQYFGELDRRFDGGFDPGKGGGKPASDDGYFVIARLEGEAVGCGALRALDEGVGEIKRVWVSGKARGQGVAGKIMEKLERLARENGFDTLRLDTNKALTEAHALYGKLGYRDIERYNDNPYAHRWFEKRLPLKGD